MILIIGATGNIGSELTRQLIAAGHRPRLGVRSVERARGQFGDRAEYVHFDFQQIGTFLPALTGVGRLFFIAAHDHPVPSIQALLRAASEARVQHVTFSSGRTTGDMKGRPMHEAENTVRARGIGWTILRPGWFMQNFTGWIGETIPEEGKFYLPAGDAQTAFIDVRDIAAVALETLLKPTRHEYETYELTSDEAHTHREVAELMSRAAGRLVEYVDMEPEAYVQWQISRGWPEETARHTAFLYDQVKTGKEAEISPDVERVLGRPSRRLGAFIQENADFWRGT